MRFTILAFLLVSLAGLSAQVDSLTTFQVGLGGGQYFSSGSFSFLPNRAAGIRTLAGPQFGVGVRYFNRRSIGFIAELNYSSGGWREEINEISNGDTLTGNYDRELAFAEIQLITQLAVGRKRFRPLLEFGPFLAIPVQDQETLPTNVTVPTGEYYFGLDIGSRLNYGIIIGGGVYIDLGKAGLQLSGRYLTGVRDTIQPGNNGVTTSRREAFGWRTTIWVEL
ncbi:MAG: outer membrane beta-barrel protein [Bacteroidota bacterium]